MFSQDNDGPPRVEARIIEHTKGSKLLTTLDRGVLYVKSKDFIDDNGEPIEQRCQTFFTSVDFGTILLFLPEGSVSDEVAGEAITEVLNVLMRHGILSPTDSNIGFNSNPDL